MSTREAREIIIYYWCRVLLSSSHSFKDIAKLIVEFRDEFDIFDTSISSDELHFG